MDDSRLPRFEFTIEGFAENTFHVVSFTGKEGLSQLYEFDILLACAQSDIDPEKVRKGIARLTLKRQGAPDLPWSGIILSFEDMEQSHGYSFYRARLAPKAWRLTHAVNTQIFLDSEMRRILDQVLKQSGLTQGQDYEFRLNVSYPRREWVCQYDETTWNFINRMMERAGLYLFFEQTAQGEKMVITDNLDAHAPMRGEPDLEYRPGSGLDSPRALQTARTFRRIIRQQPGDVVIRDYNYRTASQVEGREEVGGGGVGTLYRHVEDLRSGAEARFVAKVRAQAVACRGTAYSGETGAPFLRPGAVFRLTGHSRDGFNRKYLAVSVNHEGHQEAYVASTDQAARQDKPFYRNTFEAIEDSVQYRPEARTPRPYIGGPLTAFIDGEGSGKYAEVDAMGRYKVRFPFDLSGRKDGKASHWIRMLSPYGGDGHGLHLPLHKGTEVLVVFRNGNPDLPIIAGAVPNQRQKMTVTQDNCSQARLTTSGGNLIHIEDMEGQQRVLIASPTKGTYMRIGSPNDPEHAASGEPGGSANNAGPGGNAENGGGHDSGGGGDEGGGEGGGGNEGEGSWQEQTLTEEGYKIYTNGWFTLKAQESAEMILGNKNDVVGGLETATVVGGKTETILGVGLFELIAPFQKVISPESTEIKAQLKELNASVQRVTGEMDRNIGEVRDLIGQQNLVLGQQIDTVAERVGTIGRTVKTQGEQITTVDRRVLTCATQLDTVEKRVLTCATKQQLSDSNSLMAQELSEMASEVNRMHESVTHMSQQVTEMGESRDELVEDVTMLMETLMVL